MITLEKIYIYIHETPLLSGQINGFSRFVLFTDDLESAFNGRAEREGERRAAKGQKPPKKFPGGDADQRAGAEGR